MSATDVDEFTELLNAWDEQPACEAPGHEKTPTCHAGEAVWKARIHTPCCRNVVSRLYCEPFEAWLREGSGTVSCPACHRLSRPHVWHRSAKWVRL